jgi:hypothetical protein
MPRGTSDFSSVFGSHERESFLDEKFSLHFKQQLASIKGFAFLRALFFRRGGFASAK